MKKEDGHQKSNSFWSLIVLLRTIACRFADAKSKQRPEDAMSQQEAANFGRLREEREKLCTEFVNHPKMKEAETNILIKLRRNLMPNEYPDVADTLNIILARVIEGIAAFRGNTEREFWGWLWRIVHNAMIDRDTSPWRGKLVSEEVLDVLKFASWTDPEGPILVDELLSKLSERRRVVVNLQVAGFNLEEIGNIIGLSTAHIQRELKAAQKELVALVKRVRTKDENDNS